MNSYQWNTSQELFISQILVDFTEHFTDNNSDAFIDTWPEFGKQLKEVFKHNYQSEMTNMEWSEDIVNFLILIILFPRSPGRNGLASRLSFEKAAKKLIIFSKVIFEVDMSYSIG